MKRSEIYVRSIALNGLPEFIETSGGNSQALFQASGIDLENLSHPSSFSSWNNMCNLLETCAVTFDNPTFGIDWGLSLSDEFSNSGPLFFIAPLVKDIREFLSLAIQYQKLHTNGVHYSYEENFANKQIIGQLNYNPKTTPCQQMSEHIVTAITQMGIRHFHKDLFEHVSFEHSQSREMSFYESVFNCSVSFDMPRTQIITPQSFINEEVGGSMKMFEPLLKVFLNSQLKKNPRRNTSIQDSIQEVLPRILGVNKIDMVTVARSLGISAKKLQRLLRDEGVTYSQVLDSVREDLAIRHLRDSNISITHLSGLLDYSSGEAFNTACHRWFGMPPLAYRKALQSQQD